MWLSTREFVHHPLSSIVPLSSLSKPFDSHGNEDIIFLFTFVSFMLPIAHWTFSCWLSDTLSPSVWLWNWLCFLYLSYLCLSQIESHLYVCVYHISHVAASITQPSLFMSSASLTLVFLTEFTLRGCPAPNWSPWFSIFLAECCFSFWCIGSLCLLSTIHFFSFLPIFPKISFSVLMGMGLLNVFLLPKSLSEMQGLTMPNQYWK